MVKGQPDFFKGIVIEGITIPEIPINIVAQTLGVVKIDISAQSLGTVNVNIASSTTLNVSITGSTITLNVNIASQGAFNLNVNIAASGITLQVNIASQTANLNVNIAASGITLQVNIASQTANLNVNIAASAITLNVSIQSSAVTLNVNIASSTTLNVSITGSTITLNVNISSQSAFNLNVNLAASAITLNVSIQSSAVTLNVSVTSSVAINIQTSGGTNIVIDQLTQAAYLERRSTLSNNGETFNWSSPTGNSREGKFFPRGCRGFISSIAIYCQDVAAAGGTIYVFISPQPNMGYLYAANLVVPVGGGASWREVTFNVMWNYDSLFIFVYCSVATVQYAYDYGTPNDGFSSIDAGATWNFGNWRLWFRVYIKAETTGDLPVSGTINAVAIPSIAAHALWASQTSPWGQETTIANINGAGKTLYIELHVAAAIDSDHEALRVYCDGTLAFSHQFTMMNTYGYGASTPGISLTKFAVDGECVMLVTLPFEFRRQLSLRVYNYGSANHTDDLRVSYALIK